MRFAGIFAHPADAGALIFCALQQNVQQMAAQQALQHSMADGGGLVAHHQPFAPFAPFAAFAPPPAAAHPLGPYPGGTAEGIPVAEALGVGGREHLPRPAAYPAAAAAAAPLPANPEAWQYPPLPPRVSEGLPVGTAPAPDEPPPPMQGYLLLLQQQQQQQEQQQQHLLPPPPYRGLPEAAAAALPVHPGGAPPPGLPNNASAQWNDSSPAGQAWAWPPAPQELHDLVEPEEPRDQMQGPPAPQGYEATVGGGGQDGIPLVEAPVFEY